MINRPKKALILAVGFGKRLQSITEKNSKVYDRSKWKACVLVC